MDSEDQTAEPKMPARVNGVSKSPIQACTS